MPLRNAVFTSINIVIAGNMSRMTRDFSICILVKRDIGVKPKADTNIALFFKNQKFTQHIINYNNNNIRYDLDYHIVYP